MDTIMDIDAPSFAARTGHVAAAELYGLLTDSKQPDWLGTLNGDLGDALGVLAPFLIASKVDKAETLWREALDRRLVPREAARFADLPFARQLAYETFARVVLQTHTAIDGQQARIRSEQLAARQAAAQAPLKREDSILEEQEPLDKLIEGGEAFLAAQTRRVDRRRFNGAPPAAFDHDGDGRPGGSKPKDGAAKPGKRSIGSTPPAAPVNRGGRGRRKAPRDKPANQ